MSVVSRVMVEMGHALSDAYGHLLHGDDAGKSAKLIFVARPVGTEGKYALGLTFLEVNGRAYVKSVHPASEAAKAGVQIRDAVQFVAVLGGTLATLAHDEGRAASYALECEKAGMRTSYTDLRTVFEDNCLVLPDHSDNNSSVGPLDAPPPNPSTPTRALSPNDKNRIPPGTPGTTDSASSLLFEEPSSRKSPGRIVQNTMRSATQAAVGKCGPNASSLVFEEDDDVNGSIILNNTHHADYSQTRGGSKSHATGGTGNVDNRGPATPCDPVTGEVIHPVIMVFRRTRKRQTLGGMPHIGLPAFRIDDECDRAARLVRRLAPTADTAPQPDAWDEIVHDTTDWLLPTGSILPPHDLALLSSTANTSPGGESLPPALDPPAGGSLSPKTLPNSHQLSPSTNPPPEDPAAPPPTPDDTIPLDPLEAKSSEKLSQVRSRMYAEAIRAGTAGHRGGSDDIEASTIRGMIQNAVGLAFVRTSKVVLGVSMHGGSGIVIARLSDGTWSAPSAIGTWGLGFGIQFGLEVADYIFILQTEDSLHHFRRGGNFTIGGNVGAAFAGLGREAYGAASVGMLCGSPTNAMNTTVPAENASSGRAVSSSPLYCDPSSAAFIADTATAVLGGKPNKAPRKGSLDTDYEGEDTDDDVATKQHRKTSSKPEFADGTAEIAPIVAYAKSQGLYFGVSLEGSRIFTRDDINSRTYKFSMGREVSAHEILTGQVPTPPEAEDLYASLHSVEFTHEMASLPRPPEVLRADSQHAWRYDRSTLGKPKLEAKGEGDASTSTDDAPRHTAKYSFLDNLTEEQAEECAAFETKFKKFMYGGVSVQRVAVPNSAEPATNKARKERRTLWLMLPEVGALRLGFISKLNDNPPGDTGAQGAVTPTNKSSLRDEKIKALTKRVGFDLDEEDDFSRQTEDQTTIMSEEGTYDDTVESNTQGSTVEASGMTPHSGTTSPTNRLFKRKNGPLIRAGNVQLSSKYSVALTDVTVLSQEPNGAIRFNPDDATEHLRLISIQDSSGTSLLFLANSFREAELLVCGLKLLLERETARLGVRGGVSLVQLGGVPPARGAMSPEAARGYRTSNGGSSDGIVSRGTGGQSQVSVESSDDGESYRGSEAPERRQVVPEGRRSWSQVPGRSYLREMASRSQSLDEDNNNDANSNGESNAKNRTTSSKDDAVKEKGGKNTDEKKVNVPNYVHGQLLIRDIATNVTLPLPLPLCRVLLLDSSSPVIAKWEADRGDMNYNKSQWTFPPATPRELERHASEHQLIASGSMMGAHRTTSYDRVRHGDIVHLSETQIVDADDTEKLAFTVSERLPRRGFAVKVRILLRAVAPHSCDATILGEVRPLGKNMSNQLAVHKAFLLVISEIKMRYGTEGKGLLAGFLNVVNNLPDPGSPYAPPSNDANQRAPAAPAPASTPAPAPALQTSGQSAQNQPPPKDRTNSQRQPLAPSASNRGLQKPRNKTSSTNPDPAENGRRSTNNFPPAQEPQGSPDVNGSSDVRGAGSDRVGRKETASKNAIAMETAQRNGSTGVAGVGGGGEGVAPLSEDKNAFVAFEDVLEPRKTVAASRNPGPTPRDRGTERPPTPSMVNTDQAYENTEPPKNFTSTNVFAEMPNDEYEDTVKKPVTIEVKPLPKIRLSLMPSPREEDEENESSSSPSQSPKKSSTRSKKNGTLLSARESRRRRSNRHSV